MTLTQADIERLKQVIKDNRSDQTKDIQSLLEANVLQTEQIKHLTATVETLTKAIFGNGKPGIIAEIVSIKQVVGIIKWAATILGSAIILFLWAIFTGQLSVVK